MSKVEPISAPSFIEGISKLEGSRSLVRDHFREVLTRALDGDAETFTARLIEVLADMQADQLIAMIGAQAAEAGLSDEVFVTLAAAPRLDRGSSRHRASLGPDLVGRGWHPAEPISPGVFHRWSGPGTLSSIFLPHLTAGTFLAEGVVRFMLPEARESFRLRLAEGEMTHPIFTSVEGNSLHFETTLQLAEGGRSNFTRIEFFCQPTGKPNDFDQKNSDRRSLGFYLQSLSLTAV